MIFLATTAAGLEEALRIATPAYAVWCGSDAITAARYAALAPVNLSRFNGALGDRSEIESALATIAEHHPRQTIWVEEAVRSDAN